MKHRAISGDGSTFLLVYDQGDEIQAELEAFLVAQDIAQASFSAIGALSSVELIAFHPDTKQYHTSFKRDDQCELANLAGNAARKDGQSVIHAHLTVAGYDGTAHAGHLKRAVVHPTCEMVLHVYPTAVPKKEDPAAGLDLYHL